jgi:2-amino-4-hydroxy-6-hydroxymethyldihydropteridine diphosphokinase
LSTVTVYVALGSNLEEPVRQLRNGLEALGKLPDTRIVRVSSFYRSAPVGYADQPDFVNAVAVIETGLAPRALLDALLDVERRHGRVREFPNAPRTLDLDIVAYGDRIVDEPGLAIPHPRMHERAFVMVPLAEIAPDATIPGRGTVSMLAARVDGGSVARIAT